MRPNVLPQNIIYRKNSRLDEWFNFNIFFFIKYRTFYFE